MRERRKEEDDILSPLNVPNPYPPGTLPSTSTPGGSFSVPSPLSASFSSFPVPSPARAVEQRIIVWKDGVPLPATCPVMPKDGVEKLALTALSMPFEPVPMRDAYLSDTDREKDKMRWDKEQKYVGLTNGEVMMIRLAETAAGGDLATAKELLDRILGKPKQQIESKTMNISYSEYLKAQAEKDKQGGEIIDGSVEEL